MDFYNYFVIKRFLNNTPYRKFSLNCKQHSNKLYVFLRLRETQKAFAMAIIFFSLFFPTTNLDGLTEVACRIFFVC